MLYYSICSDTLDLYLDGKTLHSGELRTNRNFLPNTIIWLTSHIVIEHKAPADYQVNAQSDWLHKGHLTIDRRHRIVVTGFANFHLVETSSFLSNCWTFVLAFLFVGWLVCLWDICFCWTCTWQTWHRYMISDITFTLFKISFDSNVVLWL